MNLRLILQSVLRAFPFRFIGEVLILGIIVIFVAFRIGEEKTVDWRQLFKNQKAERSIDPEIVIIKIDDYAFRSIPGGNVNREYIAELVEELKSYSPRVIGLDFLFTTPYSDKNDQILSEFRKSDPEYIDPDQRLQRALQSDIPMVLGADLITNDKEKVHIILPIDSFLVDNVSAGFTKVVLDKDEVCREVNLFVNLSGTDIPAFSTQVCLLAGNAIEPDYTFKQIRYYSSAKTFASFSGKDILDGKFQQVSDNWFKDKIILIGVTYSGSNDFFKTPLSGFFRNREDLPGIFIHAITIKNILNQTFIPAKKRIYNLVMLVITMVILVTGIILNRKVLPALLLLIAGMVHILICFRLFLNDVNLPFLAPLLIIIAGVCMLFLINRSRKEYINAQIT